MRTMLGGLVWLGALTGCALSPSGAPTGAFQPAGAVKSTPAIAPDEATRQAMLKGTAYLVSGVAIGIHPDDAAGARMDLLGETSDANRADIGVATAIDRDGYLLTAAHLVQRLPLTVVLWDGRNITTCDARVVWKSPGQGRSSDLAVVAIDARLPAPFAWPAGVTKGDAVFSCGPEYESDPLHSRLGIKSGVLLGRDAASPARTGTEVWLTDLPLHPGDSGSGLVGADGRLAGINVAVKTSRGLFGRSERAVAVRPNWTEIRALIEADRRAHPRPRGE